MRDIRVLNLIEDKLVEMGRAHNDAPLPEDHDDALIDLACYRMIIEFLHVIGEVRNVLVREEAAGLERLIKEAAPVGANPKVHVNHPSTLPPDPPRLRVVREEEPDDPA